MTETPILDESAVSEIEDRPTRVNTRFEEIVILTRAERDALCATVKQLRAENERLQNDALKLSKALADELKRQ